jgi:hypothetical protein
MKIQQIKAREILDSRGNPTIFLGGVWFIIHRYCFSHFHFEGWVGGLSQMKLTSFEKNSHFDTEGQIRQVRLYNNLKLILFLCLSSIF